MVSTVRHSENCNRYYLDKAIINYRFLCGSFSEKNVYIARVKLAAQNGLQMILVRARMIKCD